MCYFGRGPLLSPSVLDPTHQLSTGPAPKHREQTRRSTISLSHEQHWGQKASNIFRSKSYGSTKRGAGLSDLGKNHLSAVEANWVDVQFIERRLDKGRVDLEEILLQTGASLDPPDPVAIPSWKDVSADFQLLYHRLIYLQLSSERINGSITGLASIVGNRQAFREQQLSLHAAEKSRGLTFIGLVFIPLAFVSSLFSMSEPYGPGGDRFWL